MWIYILIAVLAVLIITTAIQYHYQMKAAYERLKAYNVQTLETGFGTMSYLDEGNGTVIIISHGIFGGYDQGMSSLKLLLSDDCRKISLSRFGYPGSALPAHPTPQNQAKVMIELLDELGIEQTYILTTSAGGAAGLRFALNYPDRVAGLILLSSGVPDKPRTAEEIKELGMLGPPPLLLNNFLMWFLMKYFGFIFNAMMGSKVDSNTLYETMLPVAPRRQGIITDTNLTNMDMSLHYEDYPLEQIKAPILVIHSKNDPMASYGNIEQLLARVTAEKAIFETGGHLISGHGDEVSQAVANFVRTHT